MFLLDAILSLLDELNLSINSCLSSPVHPRPNDKGDGG